MPRIEKNEHMTATPLTPLHDDRPSDPRTFAAAAILEELWRLQRIDIRKPFDWDAACKWLGHIEWVERIARAHGFDLSQLTGGLSDDEIARGGNNYTLVPLDPSNAGKPSISEEIAEIRL